MGIEIIGGGGLNLGPRRCGLRVLSDGFSPPQISGLKFWVAADKIVGLNDGDAVATWSDLSGLGYNATAAGAAQPTYKTGILGGKPVVRFNGTSNYMRTAGVTSPAQAQPYTIFCVGRSLTLGASKGAFFDVYSPTFRGYQDRVALSNTAWGEFRWGTNPFLQSANGSGDGKYNVFCGVANGAASKYLLGGYQAAAGNAGTNAISGLSIGTRGTTADIFLDGDIAEIILYSGALSDADIARVERYLGSKYSLNVDGALPYNIVCQGDSRTLGSGLSTYPIQLIKNSFPKYPSLRLNVTNHGTAGHTLADMIAEEAAVDALLDGTKHNILVVWGGLNDIGAGADVATTYARLVSLCSHHRSTGWTVISCSEIDCQSDAFNALDYHTTLWPALNTLIVANHATFSDGFAHLGNNAALQNALDTTYFNNDKVHLIAAGWGVVGSEVGTVAETV